ncbi:flagellar export chaperone FliS [Glacieibacterium frigidum]|uniref:Flagellar protein FliS n=1 Tax=Glacieibacterium frigidum TaxID=2593303 RepID=A0A552U792_9SPHN|nr:flagellar export chaperone FliS [Glacieibacterium frigidum]TRW14085.1 flagellar protein FliS [Glacieibacterium frigidum]
MHTATVVRQPAAAAAHYRDIDLAARVAAASPHQLVTMLLDGLRTSLGGAARALADRQPAQRIRTVTRALAILDALEASLDFGSGGRPARSLAALYGELRALVVAGNAEGRPELLSVAAERVATLSGAWREIAPPR